MSILTAPLPKKIKVNEHIYDINYDFRTIINILFAFEDPELTYEEQVHIMISNLYKEEVSEADFEEACKQAVKFIDCGKSYASRKQSLRIYSFEKDANYIYSGINSTHHIDIESTPDMHWWKFMSFFMDMGSECMFGELTYYRSRKASGSLTKEEKKQYEKIKDLVELTDVCVQSDARKKFFEKYHNR